MAQPSLEVRNEAESRAFRRPLSRPGLLGGIRGRWAEMEEKYQGDGDGGETAAHRVWSSGPPEAAGLTNAPVWKPRFAANTVQYQKGAADSTTSRQPDPDPVSR